MLLRRETLLEHFRLWRRAEVKTASQGQRWLVSLGTARLRKAQASACLVTTPAAHAFVISALSY